MSQKKCPGHIWYVNDNLIYADLHRLPHVNLKPIKKQTPPGVNDVSMHKLNYHWHTKYGRDIFLGHPV